MAKREKVRLVQVFMQVPFILYSLTILVMCYALMVTPFRDGSDLARGVLVRPESFTLGNFVDVWNSGLGTGVRNSLTLTLLTCVLTVTLGGVAGYAFSFFRFRARNFLFIFMYSGIFVSTMLIALPLFLQYRDLHLVNSLLGTMIIFVGLRMPFSIYLYKSFFDEFSTELIDAAKIDGLGDIRILTAIVVPLSKGVVSTVLIFNFTAVWTDYLIGLLFLQKAEVITIMPKIMYIFGAGPMSTRATPLGQGFAGLLISTVPVVIIYLLARKHYIEGLTLGGIK